MKNLKKILLIPFIFTGIALSCNENEKTDPLVGTWTVVSEVNTNCDDPSGNHELEFACDDSDCIQLIFKSDGTIKVKVKKDGIENIQTGIYEKNGNVITIIIEGDFPDPGTYVISGNTLTVVVEESDTGCTKTLVLRK